MILKNALIFFFLITAAISVLPSCKQIYGCSEIDYYLLCTKGTDTISVQPEGTNQLNYLQQAADYYKGQGYTVTQVQSINTGVSCAYSTKEMKQLEQQGFVCNQDVPTAYCE